MRPPDGNDAAQQGCAGEVHKALVRRFVEEAVNRGNLDVVADVCAPTGFGYQTTGDGPESIRELLALYRSAVPDACWTVEQQVAEGDTVVTRFTARGTQQGALLGLPPTRRPMVVPGVLISRCRDGKIAVEWAQADLLGLLQQLGVMPHLELDKAVAAAQVLRAGSLLAAEPAPRLSYQAPYARGGTSTPPIPVAPTHAGTKGVTPMYARLVAFALQAGKESVATDLARDLVPAIRQQPGCEAVTCFGDSDSGQYYLYVLWSSEEEANAAARVMAPGLERHLAGNTVAPPQRNLYPVLESA